MILSKWPIYSSNKSRFIKNQEAKGKLTNFGLRTQLSKVPILGDILFWEYKMIQIVNNFLLAGDKFMPEMHLKQPGFAYSACRTFTKNKERIQKSEETEDKTIFTKTNLIRLLFSTWHGLWRF